MSGGAGAAGSSQANPGVPKLQHSIRSKTGVQTFWGTTEVKKADGFEWYSYFLSILFRHMRDFKILSKLHDRD